MNKLVMLIAVAGITSSTLSHADKVFRLGKGARWDCKDDPIVHIAHGKGTYAFKGSCKSISLEGGSNTLTVESSEELNVAGANNHVTIDTVDSISLIGSNNSVTYRSAIHGDHPSVSDIGKNNVITGGKAAGGDKADKPAASEAPADAKGAHDCARSPTAVIDNGDGNYRFVGPCTRIAINGGDNTVAIESVIELAISGAGNTVNVGGTDRIKVYGNDNKVTYKKGLTGAKPKVSTFGNDNTITQTK
jgi:hypothetical protein